MEEREEITRKAIESSFDNINLDNSEKLMVEMYGIAAFNEEEKFGMIHSASTSMSCESNFAFRRSQFGSGRKHLLLPSIFYVLNWELGHVTAVYGKKEVQLEGILSNSQKYECGMSRNLDSFYDVVFFKAFTMGLVQNNAV